MRLTNWWIRCNKLRRNRGSSRPPETVFCQRWRCWRRRGSSPRRRSCQKWVYAGVPLKWPNRVIPSWFVCKRFTQFHIVLSFLATQSSEFRGQPPRHGVHQGVAEGRAGHRSALSAQPWGPAAGWWPQWWDPSASAGQQKENLSTLAQESL